MTRRTHTLRINPILQVGISDVLRTTACVVAELYGTGTCSRFVANLPKPTYEDSTPTLPSPTTGNSEVSTVFIGRKGWQRICTPENCELILSQMRLRVRLNGKQRSLDVRFITENYEHFTDAEPPANRQD